MGASKTVRFADDEEGGSLTELLCTIPHREDFSDAELNTLFFSRADYHLSRSSAKVISKESEKFGYSKNLDGVYQEKSKEIQDCLNLWAASGHTRRGLERWANRRHGEQRQQDQFNAIMTVLREQDDMITKKGKVNDEALRKVSHKATRTSRHFARMMGKADSYARAAEMKADDETSLGTAMTLMTGYSDEDGRSGGSLSPRRTFSFSSSQDDASVDISLPAIDSMHGGRNRSERSRLRRFGFGRKKEPKRPLDDPRVSREA